MTANADPLLEEQEALEAPADWSPQGVHHWSRPVDRDGQPLPAKNAGVVNGGPHQPVNPAHRHWS